ncbi:MAG: NADH-quinone oxidoreductase subunit N, partial [Proteobacteria bacterium]|nr:NADH-quinone oxidoreductase subunit N [Pseudomonadota bacterium]
STAPKIAAVGMAIRLLTTALGQVELASQWQLLLITMALLSTGLGNLLAVSQTNIKRLLAYSAISHAGYVLFGIIAGTSEGYSAALYYILIYALMSAAAFGLITLLSRNNIEIEAVEDLRGLNKRNPWLAFMMLIVMFSMAGVPPTVGFFTKLLVLKALVDVHLTWVAILGLIFAVIGAYYYLRIVKVMYFDDAKEENPIVLPTATNLIFSANCLALLYWGILPSGLISACIAAFSS